MKIDGKKIAAKIFEDLKIEVQKLNAVPHLTIILIGNDLASLVYVRQKKLKGEEIGAKITIKRLLLQTSTPKLIAAIEQLNNDSHVHGIIVQQPLPLDINTRQITESIDPKKDVDGFHSKSKFQPPIAEAVLKILEKVRGATPGVDAQKIVVIGKGETGGGPIIQAIKRLNIDPIIIDSKTRNPQSITKNADIIISAVGKPNVITSDMIKKGVILISIGMHKENDGKLHGDYEENQIKNKASFYTPTPGGVGPVNVAMLLKNLVDSTTNLC